MKEVKIKCWIELYEGKEFPPIEVKPIIWHEKPSKREIKNMAEFNYKIVPCEIVYKI